MNIPLMRMKTHEKIYLKEIRYRIKYKSLIKIMDKQKLKISQCPLKNIY
jgi:hypothetical protein